MKTKFLTYIQQVDSNKINMEKMIYFELDDNESATIWKDALDTSKLHLKKEIMLNIFILKRLKISGLKSSSNQEARKRTIK